MSTSKQINGSLFKKMVYSAANHLEAKKEEVDRLNVFPVPDGDTGTNMAMTLKSSAKFVAERATNDSVGELSQQMAYGALMGARGNSGVILSQILSGFAGAIKDKDNIDTTDIVSGLSAGANAAYDAVSNPMEGTVLTIVREASEALSLRFVENMSPVEAFEIFLDEGYASLKRTPELLPVLKQAGVVDAGAQGFLFAIEGFISALKGRPIDAIPEVLTAESNLNEKFDHFFTDPDAIIYPYCTEFLIHNKGNAIDDVMTKLKEHMQDKGDCMLVVGAGDTVKVHIHTNDLGAVLGFASTFGELNDIKINNMREQNRELQSQGLTEESDYAIITVVNGSGLENIFKSMGATEVIYGGQTMNPGTQDFLNAIEGVNAKHIILLPNNKNIIMTAEQAANIAKENDVYVVPSKTIPEGLMALMAFIPDESMSNNIVTMIDALEDVSTGEITNAVRDSKINGINILENQYMAILDGVIIAAEDQMNGSLNTLVDKMIANEAGLITLYYGAGVSETIANEAMNDLSAKYEDVDFECYDGGQQVYPYIVSAE